MDEKKYEYGMDLLSANVNPNFFHPVTELHRGGGVRELLDTQTVFELAPERGVVPVIHNIYRDENGVFESAVEIGRQELIYDHLLSVYRKGKVQIPNLELVESKVVDTVDNVVDLNRAVRELETEFKPFENNLENNSNHFAEELLRRLAPDYKFPWYINTPGKVAERFAL